MLTYILFSTEGVNIGTLVLERDTAQYAIQSLKKTGHTVQLVGEA